MVSGEWGRTGRIILTGAYIVLVMVMFFLPLWSFSGYSIIKNTTSHLGAQGSPHAWIMNLTFIAIGLATFFAVTLKVRSYPFHVLVIGIFSASLVGTGLFRHEPLVGGVPTNETQAILHSFFATVTGVAFAIFTVSFAFISTARRDRILAIAEAILATGLSIAMTARPDSMGLSQRTIFFVTFAWLIYVTSPDYRLS
jgi:hypothetical membrane protein